MLHSFYIVTSVSSIYAVSPAIELPKNWSTVLECKIRFDKVLRFIIPPEVEVHSSN